MIKAKVLAVGMNNKGQRYIKAIIPGIGIVEGVKTMGVRAWVLTDDSAKVKKRDEISLWVILDVAWRETMSTQKRA